MKITLKTVQPERKLIAVMNGTCGLFVRVVGNACTYLSTTGVSIPQAYSLEEAAIQSPNRTPVYEGDTIEVAF